MTWSVRELSVDGYAVRIHEAAGRAAGPTVVVLAGVHGDEAEPVCAVADLIERPPALTHGRLRLVPVVNPAAWAAGTRRAPEDGKDLARCFPGAPGGSFSERLAHLVVAEVLEDADLLLDLHSAGLHYGMPLLAGCLDDGSPGGDAGIAAARAMGLPFLWLHDEYGPGRTVSAIAARGKPAIYVESGGGPAIAPGDVAACVAAVQRLLAHLGMAAPVARASHAPRVVRGGGDLDNDVVRSPCSGLFVPAARPGDVVDAGEPVGAVRDLETAERHAIAPGRRSVIMLLRRTANVRAGDVIAGFADPAAQ